MREQVIAQKVGNRSGIGGQRRSGGANQRPTRRESGGEVLGVRLRALLSYVPAFLKIALAIVVGVVAFAGYRTAASTSFFQLHNVEVQGSIRVSAEEVQAIVHKEVEKTGVWKADLNGLNARLERLPWIRTAIVSRVLPDRIRVRITERVPRAVVRTASGRFRWVDDDAVLLGEMLPTDQMPAFFLRGLDEEDPESARDENRERVAKFLELQRDWETAGLSERVSEVNLIDVRDVRAQLAGDNSQIEVRLGSVDYGKRLKDALDVLDAQQQAPQGSLISYIDLSQGKRAIVGLTSGIHKTSEDAEVSSQPNESAMGKKAERNSVADARRDKVNSDNIRTAENKTKSERGNKLTASEKKQDKSKNPDRRKQ